jgi:hypothetical protein
VCDCVRGDPIQLPELEHCDAVDVSQ